MVCSLASGTDGGWLGYPPVALGNNGCCESCMVEKA